MDEPFSSLLLLSRNTHVIIAFLISAIILAQIGRIGILKAMLFFFREGTQDEKNRSLFLKNELSKGSFNLLLFVQLALSLGLWIVFFMEEKKEVFTFYSIPLGVWGGGVLCGIILYIWIKVQQLWAYLFSPIEDFQQWISQYIFVLERFGILLFFLLLFSFCVKDWWKFVVYGGIILWGIVKLEMIYRAINIFLHSNRGVMYGIIHLLIFEVVPVIAFIKYVNL